MRTTRRRRRSIATRRRSHPGASAGDCTGDGAGRRGRGRGGRRRALLSVARCSSTRISSSSVFRSSFEARLNSLMLRPSERPSSGSLRGPKMMSAITKMTISSGMPMEPNIKTTPLNKQGRRTAAVSGPRAYQKQRFIPPCSFKGVAFMFGSIGMPGAGLSF